MVCELQIRILFDFPQVFFFFFFSGGFSRVYSFWQVFLFLFLGFGCSLYLKTLALTRTEQIPGALAETGGTCRRGDGEMGNLDLILRASVFFFWGLIRIFSWASCWMFDVVFLVFVCTCVKPKIGQLLGF